MKGEIITLPTPTKEGFAFTGWYLDAEYTEPANLQNPILANTALYASWELKANL